MMYVTVYINDRKIAHATAQNISQLAEISNYACTMQESKGPFTEGFSREFRIEGHDREQTCWALVEKLAAMSLRDHVSGAGK